MNIKKIRIWLKEWFNTPSISIKNVKDSNISIKVNGKEKLKQLLFLLRVVTRFNVITTVCIWHEAVINEQNLE